MTRRLSPHRPVRLRVGLDLTWCRPGVVGGSEYLVVGLIRAVLRCERRSEVDLVLYAPSGLLEAHPDLAEVDLVRHAPVPASGPALAIVGARVAAQASWLRRCVARDRLDVVHHFGGTLPFSSVRPFSRRQHSSMVTVHDLQPLEHPERFGRLKRRWLALSLPRVVAAERLHVTTRAVATSLVEHLGADPEAIDVVGPGAAPLGGADVDSGDRRCSADTIAAGSRFVLYPAVSHAHKGHLDLISAVDGIDVDLILCGGEGAVADEVADAVARQDRVRHLGRISEVELAALYRACQLVAIPSHYEGFGIPVIEAMASGAPVVASDVPAIAEVSKGAARLVPPGDVEAWRAAIGALLDDPDRRSAMVARGLEVASGRTWQAAALQLVSAWHTAAAALRNDRELRGVG